MAFRNQVRELGCSAAGGAVGGRHAGEPSTPEPGERDTRVLLCKNPATSDLRRALSCMDALLIFLKEKKIKAKSVDAFKMVPWPTEANTVSGQISFLKLSPAPRGTARRLPGHPGGRGEAQGPSLSKGTPPDGQGAESTPSPLRNPPAGSQQDKAQGRTHLGGFLQAAQWGAFVLTRGPLQSKPLPGCRHTKATS